MAEIVERLRGAIHMESAAIAPRTSPLIEEAREAAAEITRLTAERDRLRTELQKIMDYHIPDQPAAINIDDAAWARRQHQELRLIAKRALEHRETEK